MARNQSKINLTLCLEKIPTFAYILHFSNTVVSLLILKIDFL